MSVSHHFRPEGLEEMYEIMKANEKKKDDHLDNIEWLKNMIPEPPKEKKNKRVDNIYHKNGKINRDKFRKKYIPIHGVVYVKYLLTLPDKEIEEELDNIDYMLRNFDSVTTVRKRQKKERKEEKKKDKAREKYVAKRKPKNLGEYIKYEEKFERMLEKKKDKEIKFQFSKKNKYRDVLFDPLEMNDFKLEVEMKNLSAANTKRFEKFQECLNGYMKGEVDPETMYALSKAYDKASYSKKTMKKRIKAMKNITYVDNIPILCK